MTKLFSLSSVAGLFVFSLALLVVFALSPDRTPLLWPALAVLAGGIAGLIIIMRQIAYISGVAERCARGDMENRIIIPAARGDIQKLMYAMNRFIDVSDAYIRESSASADHAARGLFYRTILTNGLNGAWKNGGEQLNRSAQQVRQNLLVAVRRAGNQLEQSVMDTVLMLGNSTQKLMHTAESLDGVATESCREAESVAQATHRTSENMNTVAAAVEEMSAAIREISTQVSQANTISQEAAQEGEHTKRILENLVSGSEKIGEIAELINNIAAQVNLLALNATIEASRAGEAGKGFAVVASEIKNLATRTTDATTQVEQHIHRIREEVGNTNSTLTSILSKIDRVSEASVVIASAVEEQSATTMEISKGLQQTASAVNEVAGSTHSMAQSSSRTQTAAKDMHQSSASITQASEVLKEKVNEFLTTIEKAT